MELFVCGGCNAKMGAEDLSDILKDINVYKRDDILVGFDSNDDAAVIKLNEKQAIINTVDFFPPLVADPYIFGQIAATNALSDVYAMGGEVISALNIVAFDEKENINILKEILKGGADKVKEAGATLCGGHSILDSKIKYGLAVTGIVEPNKIWRNNTANDEDIVFLTKKLGTGLITAAYPFKECSEIAFNECIESMKTLNLYAKRIMQNFDITACTDITGFGLSGHLLEFCKDKTIILKKKNIPIFSEAIEIVDKFLLTAGAQKNRNFAKDKINLKNIDFKLSEIIFDPQSSGGLLFSVPFEQKEKLKKAFKENNQSLYEIGRIEKKDKYIIDFE